MSFNTALGLSAVDVRVLEQVRTRFYPLVYSLDLLLAEMAANMETPPSWNAVLRYSALVKSNLRSIFLYFNEPVKTPEGGYVRVGKIEQATVSDILASLNPYPISPFPTFERNAMLQKILEKKLKPEDEAYVDARIREAANFCQVPADWGIVPSLETQNGNGDSKDSGEAKREVTDLDENELREIWKSAGQAVLEEFVFFSKVVKDDDAGYDSDDPDSARIREIRKELNMEMDSAEESSEQEHGAQAQPVEQAPLPFEVMLKFATRGAVEVPTRAAG